MIGSKSDHIRSAITVIAINDNKVTITRIENNLSINNCTIANMDIKWATTKNI
jgi:hypothetical protein